MGDQYYGVIIGEVKDRPFQEEDEVYRAWYLLVQDQFPEFDKKQYRTGKGANMALRRIKKHFPDIPLEVFGDQEVEKKIPGCFFR